MACEQFGGTITQTEVFTTTWKLDNSMVCRWSDGATIQAKVPVTSRGLYNGLSFW